MPSAESADRLRLLDEASTLLSATPDFETTLRWVARLVVPRLADWCIIDLVDEDEAVRRLEVAHVDPRRNELAQALRAFPSGPDNPGSPASEVIRTGEAQLHPETTDDLLMEASRRPEHLEVLRSLAPSSAIVVPFRARGRVLGALSLFAAESGRHYTEADLALAQELARRCALAIDNARILAAERRARAVSQSLQAITAALSQALSPGDAADIIINQGLPGAGAAAGAVALLDESGQTLDMLRTVGYPPHMVQTFQRTPISGRTPMAEAARTGQPVWREAQPQPDERFSDYERANTSFPVGAALPLVANGRVLGALALSFTDRRRLDDEDRAFATALAAQCAQALERARLYQAERRARAAAEASASQLEVILRGVADGIIAQDPANRLVYANDAAARIIGYPSAEALIAAAPAERQARFEVADERGQPLAWQQLPGAQVLRGEPQATALVRFRVLGGGDVRWSLVSALPVRDERGEVVFAISIFRDITEQQQAQQQLTFLAEASTLLAASLEPDVTLARLAELAVPRLADACVIDVVETNGQVRRLPIVAAGDGPRSLRASFDALGPPDPAGPGAAAHVLRTGQPILAERLTEESLAASARDARHLAMLRAAQLRSSLLVPLVARNTVLGAMTLLTTADSGRTFTVDDLALAEELARRAAQALDHARLYEAERSARTDAQRAVGARDEFLSVAAHELRTPVTALKATAQFLLRTQARGALDTERLLRLLQSMDQQSSRLASLTDDLLDVSRIRTRHIQLKPRLVDLPALMRGIIQRYQDRLSTEHVLTLSVAEHVCPVLVDPDRFEQVVLNLLSNAVKYTPQGGTIEVDLEGAEGGVLLAVRDRGIGLPLGSAEAIFERFGRASNAARRQIQGMGLGLHIAREIVQKHGGRIWATSSGEDQGTTFSVWLPCGDEAPPGT